MKVLLINSVCGVGSTGRICTDLAVALENHQDTAVIAYGRNSSMPEEYQKFGHRIGNNLQLAASIAHTRLTDHHGFASKKITREFITWIDHFQPDIIHLHNVHGYYINIQILFHYLKMINKPVIWTLHDCWTMTGHCAYFDYAGCDKWRKCCGNCPQKNTYPRSIVIDRSKDNLREKKELFSGLKKLMLVTPSQWLADLTRETYLSAYPVTAIHNGIDTTRFKPIPKDKNQNIIPDKKIVLGVSMGWAPHKHLDYMIRMANDLGDSYKIVLIGLSPKQISMLPSNVVGLERTQSVDELIEWYSAADVFVNPTMEDNYPTVNLEAQACGTPVVTFNSGGSAESIQEGYGIAVERGNYQSLLEATVQATEFKKTKQLPHIPGRNEFAEEYLKIYNQIV